MTPENAEKVFQAAEAIFDELEVDARTTYKSVNTRIAQQTGLAVAVVTPVLQSYIKQRADLKVKKGRIGGIYRIAANGTVAAVTIDDVESCNDCGQVVPE